MEQYLKLKRELEDETMSGYDLASRLIWAGYEDITESNDWSYHLKVGNILASKRDNEEESIFVYFEVKKLNEEFKKCSILKIESVDRV